LATHLNSFVTELRAFFDPRGDLRFEKGDA
jgi:hypothetical protein